jgi:hypothetical protein
VSACVFNAAWAISFPPALLTAFKLLLLVDVNESNAHQPSDCTSACSV